MDSGIDLNPPPLGLLLLEKHSFFWEGKGFRSCLGPVLGHKWPSRLKTLGGFFSQGRTLSFGKGKVFGLLLFSSESKI